MVAESLLAHSMKVVGSNPHMWTLHVPPVLGQASFRSSRFSGNQKHPRLVLHVQANLFLETSVVVVVVVYIIRNSDNLQDLQDKRFVLMWMQRVNNTHKKLKGLFDLKFHYKYNHILNRKLCEQKWADLWRNYNPFLTNTSTTSTPFLFFPLTDGSHMFRQALTSGEAQRVGF